MRIQIEGPKKNCKFRCRFFSAFRIGFSGMHHATLFRKHLLSVLINISVNYQNENLGTALDYPYLIFQTSMRGRFLSPSRAVVDTHTNIFLLLAQIKIYIPNKESVLYIKASIRVKYEKSHILRKEEFQILIYLIISFQNFKVLILK